MVQTNIVSLPTTVLVLGSGDSYASGLKLRLASRQPSTIRTAGSSPIPFPSNDQCCAISGLNKVLPPNLEVVDSLAELHALELDPVALEYLVPGPEPDLPRQPASLC